MYDPVVHVPLIVRYPGAAGRVDDLVSLMDLGPTIMEAAGVEIPEYCEGRPLGLEYCSARRQIMHVGEPQTQFFKRCFLKIVFLTLFFKGCVFKGCFLRGLFLRVVVFKGCVLKNKFLIFLNVFLTFFF